MAQAGYKQTNLFPPSASTFEGGTTTWSNVANATLTVATTPVLEGTHSLQVKATAATTTTFISPRKAITAGSTYFFWAPFRSNAGSASRAITATISWYNVASGGTALSTSAVTSPTITSSALDWSTVGNFNYYPTLYAPAPVGATYADVKLSISNMAANELIYFDALMFSLADPVSDGNLLTPQESYHEADVSGWTFTGTSLSVRSPGIISSRTTIGQYYGALQATSAGTAKKTLTRAVPVTAGTKYLYREAVVAQASAPITPSISWYNASSVLISTTTGTAFTPPVGKMRGVVVTDTAPVGAVTAKPSISIAAPAGYVLAFEDAEFLPASSWPGNLLPYNDSSFETSVPAALTATNGWTISGQQPHINFGWYEDGYYYAGVTPGAVGTTSRIMLGTDAPVTPGTVYEYGVTLLAVTSTPNASLDVSYRPVVVWYDASHNQLADESLDSFTTSTAVTDGTAGTRQYNYPYWSTRRAPATAAFARVGYDVQHLSSGFTSYGVDNFRISAGVVEYGLTTDNVNGKIDLVVYASPSQTASTWSVTRFSDTTGESSVVRHETGDLSRATWTASPVFIEDYEAPMGDSYWYSIKWFKADGTSAGSVTTTSVTGPVLADPQYIWLKSPGVPGVNTQVMMAAPPVWARAARQTLTDIVGRRNPIPVFDVRGTRTADVILYAWTSEEAGQVEGLLDPGSVLLIQADPNYGLPGNLYVSVGDTTREPISGDATDEGWAYTLAIAEVDRPIGGIRGSAGRTWQNVNDDNATWFDVFTGNADWQAVLLGED